MNSFPNGHNKNRYHMKSLPREVSISRRSRKTLLNRDFMPSPPCHCMQNETKCRKADASNA